MRISTLKTPRSVSRTDAFVNLEKQLKSKYALAFIQLLALGKTRGIIQLSPRGGARPNFDLIYPVGSIYLSVKNTNPGSLFGGTWVAFGSGRTLVGVNTADSNFNTVEKTGGASTVALTVAQMPSHSHQLRYSGSGNTGYLPDGKTAGTLINYSGSTPGQNGIFQDRPGTGYTGDFPALQNTGSGSAHNNLQPYITVYFWKRTA